MPFAHLPMKTVELGRGNRRSRQESENDNLFGWTVFILLMCGFAVACWIGTFYVFTHPETREAVEERVRSILAAFDRAAAIRDHGGSGG